MQVFLKLEINFLCALVIHYISIINLSVNTGEKITWKVSNTSFLANRYCTDHISKAAMLSAYTMNSGIVHITSLAILLIQNTGPLTIPTSQSDVTSIKENGPWKIKSSDIWCHINSSILQTFQRNMLPSSTSLFLDFLVPEDGSSKLL